jgi:hypothetical protein
LPMTSEPLMRLVVEKRAEPADSWVRMNSQ